MKPVCKSLCLLLSVLLLFPALAVCAANESGTLGDVSGDVSLDAQDYMVLKRYILGTFELDWHAQYRADINLDGTVDAADYMMLKRILLGTHLLVLPNPNADPDSLSDEDLKKLTNAMLANKRAENELIVFFENGVDADGASRVFASLGFPADLNDKSVYLYRSDKDETLNFEKLWVKVHVPETDIRDILFALQRNASVSNATPNYIGSWA